MQTEAWQLKQLQTQLASWAELRHNLFKMNAEVEWFEKYAMKRPYTWEKVPDDDKKSTTTVTDPQE